MEKGLRHNSHQDHSYVLSKHRKRYDIKNTEK